MSPSVVDWHGIVQITIPRPDGDTAATSCTASLIGPQVLLTAAHCVDTASGKALNVTVINPLEAAVAVEYRCTLDPDYLRAHVAYDPRGVRTQTDFALCHTIRAHKPVETMRFEVLGQRVPLKAKAAAVRSGCMKAVERECRLYSVDAAAGQGASDVTIESGSTPSSNYATSRSKRLLGPNLCPGDSGGPLYTGLTSSTTNAAKRVIRGVNSDVKLVTADSIFGASCEDPSPDALLGFSDLGQDSFKRFLNSWSAKNLVKNNNDYICGYGPAPQGKFKCL